MSEKKERLSGWKDRKRLDYSLDSKEMIRTKSTKRIRFRKERGHPSNLTGREMTAKVER